MRVWVRLLVAVVVAGFGSASFAQIDIGTTDSSDGDLIIPINTTKTLDLSQAVTGSWNAVSTQPGKGIYDPALWAVVYKFNNLTFNTNSVLTFLPHPSRCPVVILVQGTVSMPSAGNHITVPTNIGGGQGGLPATIGAGSAGLGIGGGQASNDTARKAGGGSYSTAAQSPTGTPFPAGEIYGNPSIIPLIGGSGGGSYFSDAGGDGGGAILLACRNSITLNGDITANAPSGFFGSSMAGSGGSVRVICNSLLGSGGTIACAPGYNNSLQKYGGNGRIRLEANTFGAWGTANPTPSLLTVGTTAKLWPANTDPAVQIISVNGLVAPSDPGSAFAAPDVQLDSAGSFQVDVKCNNVPTDSSWAVTVRGAPRNGLAAVYTCTFLSGNQAESYWRCTIPFTEGLQAIQARAKKN